MISQCSLQLILTLSIGKSKDTPQLPTEAVPTLTSYMAFRVNRKTKTSSLVTNHTTAPRCHKGSTQLLRTASEQALTESYPDQPPPRSPDPRMPQLPIRPRPATTEFPPLMSPALLHLTRDPPPTPLHSRISKHPHRKTKKIPTRVSSPHVSLKRGPERGEGGATQALAKPLTLSKVTRHHHRSLGRTGPGQAHHRHRATDG